VGCGVPPEMYREEAGWTCCLRGMKMGTAETRLEKKKASACMTWNQYLSREVLGAKPT
jgi:hypothetical protein